MRQALVPMLDLRLEYEYMKNDIDAAIAACLAHQGWILGPEVRGLEESIARYVGVGHAVGVSSGTEALVLALRAFAIKSKKAQYFDRRDEIITTPFTFTATGDAILRSGATPVFIDIDPATFNMDTALLKEYLQREGEKAVGVIPVHLYGRPCDMDGVREGAEAGGLFVLEDAAQALGAKWRGRGLGSIGDAGAFSFFPSKPLGAFGDAGMLVTNDAEIAGLARMLLKHGGLDKYDVEHIGYNARLDTLQAAVLLAKLKYLDEFNEKRRKIARAYSEALRDIEEMELPAPSNHEHHVYHQYTIRVKGGAKKGGRDALQEHLRSHGISSMLYYPVPLHRMKVFEGRCKKIPFGLEESQMASAEVLSLPIEPLMTDGQVGLVAERVKGFFFALSQARRA